MKPTLFVLAAGMGSRYGGLKQLDGLGPNGETIMDYSIFDAIRGGFGKLVFVIRKSFEKDFREKIISKYENHIPVEVVFQDLNDLPEGFTCPEGREKPWGTNHAVLMGKKVINEPFAVINADDFYGRDSFAVLGKQLSEMDGKKNDYCMVATAYQEPKHAWLVPAWIFTVRESIGGNSLQELSYVINAYDGSVIGEAY